MEKRADLHIHTHFSDSTSSPEEVVEEAHQQNLSCIAITDHDVLEGILPAQEAAKKYALEVLPGIELSTEYNGKDIHMLGYMFDTAHPDLREHIRVSQNARVERMGKMIAKLDALGHPGIQLEEVCALTNSDAVGRPHLAQVMVEKGIVSSLKEAFDKYIAEGAPACVPKFKITPFDAIKLIRAAGGVAVLAHPYITKVDELIPQMVEAGLGGIEVFYPRTVEAERQHYLNLVKKHGLVATGGSDAHGSAKKHTWVGNIQIPYTYVKQLKAAARG